MNQTTNQRVDALRTLLKEKNIDAFIIPSTDSHLSEYVAAHWQSREWLSGFTGSAGTVVVTDKQAGLWTDSRYFLQAARQLEGSSIDLYKEMLPETPSIPTFLKTSLGTGAVVGIDGKVFSTEEAKQLQDELKENGITIKSVEDPMNKIWEDRPAIPEGPAFIYENQYAGKSCKEKLATIREEMKNAGAEALLISALDEIAWTLNIRGNDVHCNPVVISYLLISKDEAHFFIHPQKVTEELSAYLKEAGVSIHSYEDIEYFLNNLSVDTLLLNPSKTNYAVYSAICPDCRIIEGASPVTLLKAIRNEQEIAGIHAAMQRDGVALVKFLKWLEEAVRTGKETEISVDKKLHKLRAAQPLYMGESFDTIAGYKEHGAIVHYEATPETDVPLQPKGFLLLDSGAQYLDGTTDITRTIALGELTEEEKTDYTLILKGHIALAMAVFPEGTRGAQLDVLARMPIWKHRMNFLHGTGHGVGHFLNVHEGPQSIRMNENPVALQAGMVTSNEPGVYKAGSHGIRTENLVLTIPAGEGLFGNYLKFETITLCPICKKGIIKEMLATEEIEWLNEYHRKVYDKLSPDLNKEEQEWLKEACAAITND
nr:aminopeptidase P family protein [uncultured Bacteroides sp.]